MAEPEFTESLRGLPITVKVVLRVGDNEVSAEGRIDTVYERIGEIAQALSEISEQVAAMSTEEKEETEISTSDIPVIKASRSTADNILALFSTSWGRKPRTLDEVSKALEVNGVPITKESISVYLLNLIRRGVLRRLSKEGKYAYYKIPEE